VSILGDGLSYTSLGSQLSDLNTNYSIWIDTCTASARKSGLHTQQGENPEQRRLFFKFCRFLKIPATLIFVFDRPARPPVKRGKNVLDTPLWLISYVKFLITAFGFYIHEVSVIIDQPAL
jgi:hypothetical protein